MRTIPKLLIGSAALALTVALGGALPAAAQAEPTLTIDDVAVTEGDFGTTQVALTVQLSEQSGEPSAEQVRVDFETVQGTASVTEDFVYRKDTLVIDPSEAVSSKYIYVEVQGDVAVEDDETFSVELSNPQNAVIADGTGIVTITNDDTEATTPQVSIGDRTVSEGDTGSTPTGFSVTLDKPSAYVVTVDYQTQDGTATGSDDFVAQSGTLTFSPGDVAQVVTIGVLGESVPEDDETFTVELSNAQYAVLADSTGVATIVDDDTGGAPTMPNASIDDASVTEGDSGTTPATFTVTMDQPSEEIVQVVFGTADGTATAPADYAFLGGTVVFNPGEVSKPIAIDAAGDTAAERDETFTVELSNPQNAVVADGSGVGTIVDHDTEDPPVNKPPVADDTTVSATTGEPVTVTIPASDPDGDDLSYAITQDPAHGTVDGDGPQYTYTSDEQFAGTDTFVVEACDPRNACDIAAVTVNVAASEPPAGDDNADTGDDDTNAGGNRNDGTTIGTGDDGGPGKGKQLALTGAAGTPLLVGSGIGLLVLGAALLLATRWSRRRTGSA